jgi:SHS family lactate transporter-like MFS transporter
MMLLILLPAYILPNTFTRLAVSGWFFCAFLEGIHGTLPIHLNELSPPAFRALLPGTAFQVGEMVASPSSQIVNTLAEANHINSRGKQVEAYGPVTLVFVAISAGILALCSAFGPERRGSHFEMAAAAGTIPVKDEKNDSQVDGKEESTNETKSETL